MLQVCARVTHFALVLHILHSCYTFCTRVTEEVHSFLSQSELSNFFVYIIILVKLTEQMKSEMGNMSEKLEAMRNSVTEDGGQFPKK